MTARRRTDLPTLRASLTRYRDLIDDWPAFCEAIARPLPTCLWANPARIAAGALAELLAGEAIAAAPLAWRADGLRLAPGVRSGRHWWYCAGLAHAQEEASQLPVTLLDLAPGQRVLDLCAAPGGKTAQIAFALGNRGTLVANDLAAERIKALVGNLDRLGIVNTTVTRGDGANFPTAAGQFDRILVDAPCSSEGTLRRNPDRAADLDVALSERLAARQRALLRKAVQRCRPGGRIVYSTCTFAPEENELVVADILAEQGGRLRLCAAEVPGLKTAPGVTAWAGRTLDPSLAQCLRLWPHDNDTGGFFVAVLEKDPTAPGEPEPAPAVLAAEPGDEDWVEALTDRYGLPEGLWRDLRIQRQTRRGLHLVAADHRPPVAPGAEGRGLFFQRTNIRPPKLTTAGALLLGNQATRHRLELTATQRDAYLAREDLVPSAQQVAEAAPGQVIVTYRGFPLGLAIWHRSGTLASLFPSRWSGCAGPHRPAA
jgi:NOL1/NOP2/sun family putative RNA methylase